MCRNSFSGMEWREGEGSGAVVIVDSVVQKQENHKTTTLLCRANAITQCATASTKKEN